MQQKLKKQKQRSLGTQQALESQLSAAKEETQKALENLKSNFGNQSAPVKTEVAPAVNPEVNAEISALKSADADLMKKVEAMKESINADLKRVREEFTANKTETAAAIENLQKDLDSKAQTETIIVNSQSPQMVHASEDQNMENQLE